jgi:NADPH2:quinone reductase
MKAIRVLTPGGPEALQLRDEPIPVPGPGQILLRLESAGVNFIDTYHRSGFYPLPLPFTPGSEGAGVVERVGDGVTLFRPGDRAAWAAGGLGAYADFALVAEARLVPVPAGVSSRDAAAALLQGMTAHYLATAVYALARGDSCLVHAAAGGVGLLLCQVAKLKGARVIATVSTEAKAALARQAGADEIVFYTRQEVAPEVRRLTGGRGVDVVYDGVGKDTWEGSLASLRPRGLMALYGQSSGPVTGVDPLILMKHHSLVLTRCNLTDFTATREELTLRAGEVLGWVRDGKLGLHIHREYPLAQAAQAHRDIEGRGTTGKLLLRLPG